MIIEPPSAEPVSIADVRADLRLDEGEDLLLATLITAARMVVEARSGCRLMTQKWDVIFDGWPEKGGALQLPHWPIIDTPHIFLLGNMREELPSELFHFELKPRIPQIFPRTQGIWPQPKRNKLGVMVSLTAGFGPLPSDVPDSFRLAIRQLVSFWYEQGEWQGISQDAAIPERVNALLQPFRNIQL